ncbi:MAG: undecaprenyldiphospho-muramoylpentapeptide beta-N-acetylglucosaminyltransferase [Deltaproteobacteria bacterium]|nr:undecaprenyldiphospho-muramoylpentapeptide beta-N-acetylglucosaminyltransferase [Deltaproteobacteria bacterium]
MRVVFAGGGTGGHLFPALSVADELRRRDERCDIVFIGGRGGLEERVVPEQGYCLELLEVEGLKGKRGMKRVKSLYKALAATYRAIGLLRRLKPVGVIGSGSYASGPVVLAAKLLRLKTAILEQNAIPGITNRYLGRYVDRVYVSFEESCSYFPEERVILAGNPVRREILEEAARQREELIARRKSSFTILVFGGSQGAKTINTAVLDSLEYLTDMVNSIRIIHQTGVEWCDEVRAGYERKGLLAAGGGKRNGGIVEVVPFIEDMSTAYASADLVICRAGATSIAEITALGLASVLIPYPFAADNHQEINARLLSGRGAAVMLGQDGLTGQVMAEEIRTLYNDREKLHGIRSASKALGRPGALDTIADDYLGLLDVS